MEYYPFWEYASLNIPWQSDTQRNIEANSGAFGDTVVKSMTLHWNQEHTSSVADTFDIIVASDW